MPIEDDIPDEELAAEDEGDEEFDDEDEEDEEDDEDDGDEVIQEPAN